MKGIILAAIAAIASPAAAADQFDLVCTGKKPQHFRVDLGQGVWCREECKNTLPIASISQTMIVFVDQQPKLRGDPIHNLYVDRETGKLHEYSWFPSFELVGSTTDGICEPASFSGFPVVPTKF
ncbi:hypothetical protein EIK56_22950 [Sphingomonas sp. C8-2]|nr:hypothetical protein EIK56_22950 [Sphingomonas sp. C8-2]